MSIIRFLRHRKNVPFGCSKIKENNPLLRRIHDEIKREASNIKNIESVLLIVEKKNNVTSTIGFNVSIDDFLEANWEQIKKANKLIFEITYEEKYAINSKTMHLELVI